MLLRSSSARVSPLRALVCALVLAAVLAGCSSALTGHGSGSATGASTSPSGGSSGSGGSALPPAPTQPTADFSTCPFDFSSVNFPGDRGSRLQFGCAQVSVPLDYAKPDGTKIKLQLIRVHDSGAKPIGSLVVNPGGPGASGLELAVGLAVQVSDTLLQHFDLVGFDPRGVGLSNPISCISDSEKDKLNAEAPDVTTTAGFDQARAAAKEVASDCSSKYGSALPFFNTVNTARDMDQIREAVGDQRLNYLGFSYGTELGSTYAHVFPDHVRVAVLDGAVNPLTDDIQSFANQLKGFEQAFDQFAAWCGKHSSCEQLGDPRQAVYRITAAAAKSPIPSSQPGETRSATPAIVDTGVLQALYSQSLWSSLGQALIDAGKGDAAGLFKLADQYNERDSNGHYANISDANTTISCNDSKPGPTDATIRSTAAAWKQQYPIFGEWSASSLFSCQQWQPQRTPVPLPTAPTPTKVLVIGNLHDPATPYQGAVDLARTMGNAEVLTWDGEGHTSYLQGSDCIDKYVDDYLISRTLPPADTTCPR
ncbi:MAG: alpha/beta hydrolase [Jatrophihabitans sp.]|uniref:alpha/beta hydrolase n=1 Tax=Jatrophihabitans sp. TaxID=1932789 RepID=UPI003F813576